MTIKQAIEKASAEINSVGIEMPKQKARLLMQYILKQTRQYIIIYDNKEISRKDEEMYFKYINQMKNGTPLQHITHSQEFMKMNFYVNEKVLIPRADTECLVEETIEIVKRIEAKNILELCTGSGAIAISLAKYLKDVNITAIDISEEALKVAKKNAKINEAEKQVTFVKSDLYKKIPTFKYDIIVSNPPYIKRDVIKKLNKDVQKEPLIALDGGYDGLDFYRKILINAPDYLNTNGYVCFEIGYDQREDVMQMFEDEGKYKNIYSKKDLFDNDRIVCAKLVKNKTALKY